MSKSVRPVGLFLVSRRVGRGAAPVASWLNGQNLPKKVTAGNFFAALIVGILVSTDFYEFMFYRYIQYWFAMDRCAPSVVYHIYCISMPNTALVVLRVVRTTNHAPGTYTEAATSNTAGSH